MGRIKGHYEWDDDDLTPGRKREGGLHQNLYDNEGNLKGNARFVPDDDTDPEPFVVTETVYIPLDERRRTRENDELAEFVADVLAHLLDRGIARARPVVTQWLRESAVPSIAAQRDKIRGRRERWKARKSLAVAEASVLHPSGELLESAERTGSDGSVEERPDMSLAEARARYMAALAARVYSEEQMSLVASANIVDADGMREVEHSLAEVPAEQLKAMIEAMATNPQLLSEDALAQLASLLGQRSLPAATRSAGSRES